MRTFIFIASILTSSIAYSQSLWEISYWTPKHNLTDKQVLRGSTREQLNEAGLPVEQVSMDEKGDTVLQIVFQYNRSGQLQCEKKYDAKGRLLDERNFIYDSNGLLLTSSTCERSKYLGDMLVTDVHSYDDCCNLVGTIRCSDISGTMQHVRFTYSYKDGNKIVTQRMVPKDKKRYRRTVTYNEKGLVTSIREGYLWTIYEYTYDASGEWTTKKYFQKVTLGPTNYVGEFRRTRVI